MSEADSWGRLHVVGLHIQCGTSPRVGKAVRLLTFSEGELEIIGRGIDENYASLRERLAEGRSAAGIRLGSLQESPDYQEFGSSIPSEDLLYERYSGSGGGGALMLGLTRLKAKLEPYYPECLGEGDDLVARWTRSELERSAYSVAAAATVCSMLERICFDQSIRLKFEEAYGLLAGVALDLTRASYDDEAIDYQMDLLCKQTEIVEAFKRENDRMGAITTAIQVCTIVSAVIAAVELVISVLLR